MRLSIDYYCNLFVFLKISCFFLGGGGVVKHPEINQELQTKKEKTKTGGGGDGTRATTARG